jgi:hypothetical protein
MMELLCIVVPLEDFGVAVMVPSLHAGRRVPNIGKPHFMAAEFAPAREVLLDSQSR